MFRRGVIVAIALPVLCAGVLARPAAAQIVPPGYPGPTTTVPPEETREEQDGGRVRAGQTVVLESCGFAAPDAGPDLAVDAGPLGVEVDHGLVAPQQLAVSWNGVGAGTAVVGADGCARVSLTVHGRDDAPPCPAVNVNGNERDGERGRNTLVVAGEGANGAARTVVTTVAISCSNAGNAGASAPDGSVDAGEGSGDDGVRVSVTLDDEPLLIGATRSPVVRWGGLNVALLAVAGGLLVAERRRRARRAVL